MAHERDERAPKQTCLKLLNAQQMFCALCTQPIAVRHKHAKCKMQNQNASFQTVLHCQRQFIVLAKNFQFNLKISNFQIII